MFKRAPQDIFSTAGVISTKDLIEANAVQLTVDDISRINTENADIAMRMEELRAKNTELKYKAVTKSVVVTLITFALLMIVMFALTGWVDLTVAVVAGFISTLVSAIMTFVTAAVTTPETAASVKQTLTPKPIKIDKPQGS